MVVLWVAYGLPMAFHCFLIVFLLFSYDCFIWNFEKVRCEARARSARAALDLHLKKKGSAGVKKMNICPVGCWESRKTLAFVMLLGCPGVATKEDQYVFRYGFPSVFPGFPYGFPMLFQWFSCGLRTVLQGLRFRVKGLGFRFRV